MPLNRLRDKLKHSSPWMLILYGVLLLFAVDAAIFHSGLYEYYVSPVSTAGKLNMAVWGHRTKDADNSIALCGDSRVAEGFSAKLADEAEAGAGVKFSNLAVPGTTPRVWYYMLRELDPHADRFAAVAIMLPNYDDTGVENFNERVLDLNYLAPILRYSDITSLPWSYSDPEAREHAIACSLLKGSAFKLDILDFLSNPKLRVKSVKQMHRYWRISNYDYPGHPENLAGLAPAPNEPDGLHYPDNASQESKRLLRDYYGQMTHSQSMESITRYNQLWLGKIAERYQHSRTKLVFFQIPRGPLHYLKPQAQPDSMLAALQQKYGFTILPPETFGELEHPDYFFDYIHMAASGRQQFSKQFAAVLVTLVKSPSNTSH